MGHQEWRMQDNSQVRGVGVISIKGGRGGGNTQSVGHQEWSMQDCSQVRGVGLYQ